jgi:hypothetical protein
MNTQDNKPHKICTRGKERIMRKRIFGKTLVLGIILLFIGTSVIPGISGDIEKKNNVTQIMRSQCNSSSLNPPDDYFWDVIFSPYDDDGNSDNDSMQTAFNVETFENYDYVTVIGTLFDDENNLIDSQMISYTAYHNDMVYKTLNLTALWNGTSGWNTYYVNLKLYDSLGELDEEVNSENISLYVIHYTLNITIQGQGTVTKDPDQQTYINGMIVTLTAIPTIGWSFNHWGGDISGSENPISIIISGNMTVVANFTTIHYTITITIAGKGTVTKSPDQPYYTYGQSVTLTAIPTTGWSFDHWSEDIIGTINPILIVVNDSMDITAHFLSENNPPNPPTITGPIKAKVGVPTTYNFTATDPDNDDVFYYIDWGDQTNSGWVGSYPSGKRIIQSHTWSKKGTYTIKTKAKDINDNESDWATLSVTMPLSYNTPFIQLWEKMFERFSHAFPILRQLLNSWVLFI